MQRLDAVREAAGRLTLTRQVALLSLVPMILLGFVLARVLQQRIVARTLDDETLTAQLIARIGIQPRLTPAELRNGLDAAEVRDLDSQLRTATVKRDLARIKIWNAQDRVIYSDDHTLIGRVLPPSDDLEDALQGHPEDAAIVEPRLHTETAGEVGLGTLVEVYVPLRFSVKGPPAGAFEIYLSYRPIAGAINSDKETIALLVAIGLAALWLALYPIVARASRRINQQAKENDRLARYDQLTGLPNRRLFLERLDRRLSRARAPGDASVLVLRINAFEQVHATLGLATGDRVLCEVARRLTEDCERAELVARLAEDEFAMLIDAPAGSDAASVIEGLNAAMEDPIAVEEVALNVEVTIGLAGSAEGEVAPAHELLQRAQAAAARARATGSDLEAFSPEKDSFDPARLILLGQVRGALERHEFVLHYQPKVDLATRLVTGVEALLRWEHPEHGLLAPMDFVPLIESTALVGPVTRYVVEEAVAQASRWRRHGLDVGVAVNLSARNLLDEDLPRTLIEILDRHGLPAERVTVEVTESATMTDRDRAATVLSALRAAGLAVSIDDFGTGNASIDYLARLPASELKIDRSFITNICADARSEAIVRSIIDLAGHLGLSVVAEGVETEEALETVATLGCDTAQGYVISRPLPAGDLARRLAGQAAGGRASETSPRSGTRAGVARPAPGLTT